MIHIVVRVFVAGELVSEEQVTLTAAQVKAGETIQALAGQHIAMIDAAGGKGMVEIEFLDEPDPNQRFFRIGTDPSRMVNPLALPVHKRQIH